MTLFSIDIFGFHIAPSYYGLMYILGFLGGYYYFLKKNILKKEDLENLFFYVFLGVILGGRIGYILFYDIGYYLSNPANIFAVWKGGMSFHGGFLGVIIATFLYTKKYKFSFWKIMDEIAFIVPLGLGLGRIGNYLNKELLGFPYEGFLAVEKNGVSYFPSPLLESFLEGFLLIIILYFIKKHQKYFGQISAYFLIFYGIFRVFVEIFFRTPDAHLGYFMKYFTMGTFLSLPMILLGIFLLYFLSKKHNKKHS